MNKSYSVNVCDACGKESDPVEGVMETASGWKQRAPYLRQRESSGVLYACSTDHFLKVLDEATRATLDAAECDMEKEEV